MCQTGTFGGKADLILQRCSRAHELKRGHIWHFMLRALLRGMLFKSVQFILVLSNVCVYMIFLKEITMFLVV